MEYVDGITLEEKVLESPFLPTLEVASIIRKICLALSEAEHLRIIHRDLKPANIMINKAGILKVMDFGLAKSADSVSHQTTTGKLLGTPHYMSPEQITDPANIDSRGDIYFSGGVLYFLKIILYVSFSFNLFF